jgi:hypothetical protein
MALDDPGPVVGVLEDEEREAELLDGVEAAHPEQVLLERADEALDAAVASGSRTKAGELAMPRKASSRWSSSATNWLPWSWRSLRPPATPSPKAPQQARTAWRSGSSASKRVARRAAWMPTHSVEQWSTVTKIAACPSPVMVEVRSVPHVASTLAVRIAPSWALGPCGRPTRPGANRPCARISRRTRRLEVRMPAKRTRAQTLR